MQTDLVEDLQRTLREVLPKSWRVSLSAHGPATVLKLAAPDGAMTTVLVEAVRTPAPKDLPATLQAVERHADATRAHHVLLAMPFVSRPLKERLARAGMNWFDPTGNLLVHTNSPVLFLEREGAKRNPYYGPGASREASLHDLATARVVRVLRQADLPLGVRQLGKRANVTRPTTARVLDLLSREGLIELGASGEVVGLYEMPDDPA